ncbi:MAG TPA: 1-acyl-sn-glycerol-3-phosphate acyltransferase [Bacteroidales bacterium]|mgnify:CR=1 FL=1|nr:1-acyl-sn-glycerol-3-phosphate acyltransferase [Bacteroidales bacterium]
MSFLFLKIYDFFSKRRWLLFTFLFLLVAVFVFLAGRVRFSEDILDFLPRTKELENVTDIFRLIKANDKLIVIISDKDSAHADPAKLISCAEDLEGDIKTSLYPALVRDVTNKINEEQMSGTYEVIWNNLPFFLDDEDYLQIEKMIDPDYIDSTLSGSYKMLVSPAGMFLKKFIIRDPLSLSRFALQKLNLSGVGSNYNIVNGHIFSKDNRTLLMFITSANETSESYQNTLLIKGLDKIIEENSKKAGSQSVSIQYFGAVAASVANASQMKKDFMLTMGIAVLILLIFFGMYFRSRSSLFVMLLSVLFGGLFSLALVFLLHPDISLIALGAGSLVLGIALNYSIHFYTHYLHVGSVRLVIKDLSTPLTIGSITTIGAFLGLLFVRSQVLRDFGMVAALCLVGSVLFTLIFLPFIIRIKKQTSDSPDNHLLKIIEKISSYNFDRNRYIVISIVVLTVFFLFMARKASFDTDLSKLGYVSEKLKQAEQTMNRISGNSQRIMYIVSKGNTLDESLRKNENLNRKIADLRHKQLIGQVSGVSSVLLSDSMQKAKIQKWESFWNDDRKEKIRTCLTLGSQKLGFTDDAFEDFLVVIDRKYTAISKRDFDYLKTNFAGQFVNQAGNDNFVITQLKINPRNHDAVIAAIPETENTVIVETGSLLSHFMDSINKDFNTVLLISSLLVFFFLLFSYGRIELAAIAFVPMLISWVWIMGIMGLLNVQFNIFSIIISAFIFGLGDDYSIFIMDGLLQEYKKGVRILDSYKTAVFLSAFTMFVGIGVLILARHPALRSIALLTIIGMLSVVFMSYTLVPVLFRWLIIKKNKFRKFPVTFFGLFYAIVCYSYYLAGCVLTVVLGLTVLKILPVTRKKRKYIFHYMMMLVSRSTMYVMFFTKKRFIGLSPGTFRKPALIICNHQSSIDIPLLLMFTPKIIMLTNDKMYYSKIRGILIRMSGYLPSSSGYDMIKEKLTEYFRDGYSVVIFPEGSRSPDQQIHRFHKGAFYLAESMNLDILPVVIHGTANYVAKGELFGKRSTITVKFLDRIIPANTAYGADYLERAKGLTRLYRKEFGEILDFYKQPVHYKDILIKNFIYKGPVIEWYTRIKLKIEKNYQLYNNLIPMKAKILDIGCGYGYISLMLGMISKDRTIKGIDFDEDKIALASHCLSKPANVSFAHEDILSYKMEHQDVIILSDVLHYLEHYDQRKTLEQCIANLNEGGLILIRDGNRDLVKRHGMTRLTEIFSTNFGFNKTGKNKLQFLSAGMIREVVAKSGLEMAIIDDNKVTSNVLFVLNKKKLYE